MGKGAIWRKQGVHYPIFPVNIFQTFNKIFFGSQAQENFLVSGLVSGQLVDTPTRGLPTRGLDDWRTGQLADYTTRGLDKSRTGQLVDATGNFACLVFVFWPFIDVFLHVYFNIYCASDSVSCIMST